MLVVISDLHLQHTELDGLRWRDGDRVRRVRVKRNVDAGALRVLLGEVASNVKRTGATSVDLVLAGDIFELHRTPLWLLAGGSIRPQGTANRALEQMSLQILQSIEEECWSFFTVLKEAVERGQFSSGNGAQSLGAPLRVHYIPGNHDRLVNLFPSTRERVRELLCVDAPPQGISAPFSHEHLCQEHGVLVRHGHEYDGANYAGRVGDAGDPSAYDRPTLGDYATVDIAARLAVGFRARYAKQLRTPGGAGEPYRRVYVALTEFDDVRPNTLLVRYLADEVGGNEDKVFRWLRPILREVCEAARIDEFLLREAERLGASKYLKPPTGPFLEEALKNLSGSSVATILDVVQRMRTDKDGHGPAAYALREPALQDGKIRLVIAGHTHHPDHVSLGPKQTRSHAFFLDTGTWRTRIDAGEAGSFGRLRSYTMVFCYCGDELKADRRRFETWTGHLCNEEYGREDDDMTPEQSLPNQQLHLISSRIERIDEGETRDGAELKLHIGVDDNEFTLRKEKVHNGAVIQIDHTLPIDPALDGELWAWGVEKDLGNSILDRDDPLPWLTAFLPRVAGRSSAFASTRGRIRVQSANGNAYMLEYEVN